MAQIPYDPPPGPLGPPGPRPYRVGFGPLLDLFLWWFFGFSLGSPWRSGSGRFRSLSGPSGPELGPCPALIGPFWPSSGPLRGPDLACFRVTFRGPRASFLALRARTPVFGLYSKVPWGPLSGPKFGLFSGVFGLFLAFGQKEPNPYRLVTGSVGPFGRVSGFFGLFGLFWGPRPGGPESLPTGYRVWGPFWAGFWPFSGLSRPVALGPQKHAVP